MSQSNFIVSKCMLIPNGASLEEEYEISGGLPKINYYESIESPSISMTIRFHDIDQVIGRKGITGGELVEVTVKDGTEGDEFKITKDHRMILNAVVDMNTTSQVQEATLDFVSEETFINETSRLNKKFTGNISETVKKILTDDEKGIKTKKDVFGTEDNKSRAVNSYSFIGNLKRPFDTIQWLCPKAQSANDDFGFLFFENLDGYHFKSIKELLSQEAIKYTFADRPMEQPTILQNMLEQSNDVGMNLRMGMYANKTIYVDIENQEAEVIDFDANKDLNLKKKAKLNGLEEKPTRLMYRVNDAGVSQKGAERDKKDPKTSLAVYQNKSYIRNNLLFSQAMAISIPLNVLLRAGDVIEIELPLKKGDGDKPVDSTGNDKTNDPSGKYLICELRHLIGGGKGETQLKLIRDVFTA